MKRSIVRRTNVDFCKRVEVWQGYRIIDRYLTIPGWKLEGFTAVNPRTDTPIFGKTWGNNYEGFLSNLAIQSPDKFPPEIAWRRYLDYFCRQRILPGPVIAKDYEEAMQYGEVSHHYELSIEGHTATVTFDKYYTSRGKGRWVGVPCAICISDYGRYWQGAIGTGPYMEAVEFLGGKMRHTYCSDDLDIWTIKF